MYKCHVTQGHMKVVMSLELGGIQGPSSQILLNGSLLLGCLVWRHYIQIVQV